MAALDELSLSLGLFLRAYPWRRIDPVPWAGLDKPLSHCRVAIASSAGLVLPDQVPFDEGARGGDPSYRVIPFDAVVDRMIDTHRSESFDHAGIETDRNLAFPLDRLRELAAAGEIGEVAPRHLSFMGSITAPGRLVKKTAPDAAALLLEDQVDVVLLVPV